MGTSRSHFGHQRFCWMRVWHSAWSWLKLIVAAESVAGKTRTGMLTSEILRKPFQVGRAAMGALSDDRGPGARGNGPQAPQTPSLHLEQVAQLHPEHARRVGIWQPPP